MSPTVTIDVSIPEYNGEEKGETSGPATIVPPPELNVGAGNRVPPTGSVAAGDEDATTN